MYKARSRLILLTQDLSVPLSLFIKQVRVFNYNTLERQHAFDAHSDYVRSIAAHPTQPFILTSSGESSREIISKISFKDKICVSMNIDKE